MVRVVRVLKYFVFYLVPLSLVAYLILTKPNELSKPCPPVSNSPAVREVFASLSWDQQRYTGDHVMRPRWRPVNCNAVLEGDRVELLYASRNKWCQRSNELTDYMYLQKTEHCEAFRRENGYNRFRVTSEEKNFPIAFSILMHEHVEQTERLLRLIYRPQNVYCIHVDEKASSSIHRAMAAVAACLPGVYVIPEPIAVQWAEFSVLQAEVTCLHYLWRHPAWKYYLNLSGREFPLRTNQELVKILKAYGGANDIDGTLHRRPLVWTKYVHRHEYWRTNQLKAPPPKGFVIGKGSTHVAASRDFVDYALHNNSAHALLEWMRDIRVPDEHFYPTLNHNPHMGIPGAYKDDPSLKDGFFARYKIWQTPMETCQGKWVRFICNLGVGDLARVVKQPHMFVNKLDLDLDPLAFSCMEQWYIGRAAKEGSWPDFNITFYRDQKFVKNHV